MPAEEYRSVVRSVTRAKWLAASGVIVTTAVFVPLVVFVSHGLVVPGFVVLAIWYFWFLPSHRKRVRRIYLSLPRWEIKQTSVQRAPLTPGADQMRPRFEREPGAEQSGGTP